MRGCNRFRELLEHLMLLTINTDMEWTDFKAALPQDLQDLILGFIQKALRKHQILKRPFDEQDLAYTYVSF